MIKITLKTNTVRKEVTAEMTQTPAGVFANENINTAGSQINLNGTILTAAEMNTTFEALSADIGFADGTSISLSSIIKADGAAE